MTDINGAADTGTSGGMGIGTKVILALAALTVIEYAIAVTKPPGQLLLIFVIAIAKAALIVVYFMHVKQLWGPEHS